MDDGCKQFCYCGYVGRCSRAEGCSSRMYVGSDFVLHCYFLSGLCAGLLVMSDFDIQYDILC